jgi:hypothetical protein
MRALFISTIMSISLASATLATTAPDNPRGLLFDMLDAQQAVANCPGLRATPTLVGLLGLLQVFDAQVRREIADVVAIPLSTREEITAPI